MSAARAMAAAVEDSGEEEEAARGSEPPAKRRRPEPRVQIGAFSVDPIGLGTMPLGIEYPDPKLRPPRGAAVALLHTAFRSGVELLDTADSYCAGPGGSKEAEAPHYVEQLIAEAISTYGGDASSIRVCTKGGMQRIDATSRGWRPKACSGPAVEKMIAEAHSSLGGRRPIDVFMLHHTDTLGPQQLEGALAVMKEAVRAGRVLSLGLANATVGNLELAERLGVRIDAVQNQYSLWQREAEMPLPAGAAAKSRKGVLSWCSSRGAAFMPYGVFGGVQSRDGRRSLRASFPRLVDMAQRRQASPEALVLAWMRQRFPCVVHIAGARSRQHVLDCAQARRVLLTTEEVDEISGMKAARASPAAPLAPPSSSSSQVYLEPGALEGAQRQLFSDLEADLRQLEEAVGVRLAVSGARNSIVLSGAPERHAEVVGKLDEIARFYFGQGIPR